MASSLCPVWFSDFPRLLAVGSILTTFVLCCLIVLFLILLSVAQPTQRVPISLVSCLFVICLLWFALKVELLLLFLVVPVVPCFVWGAFVGCSLNLLGYSMTAASHLPISPGLSAVLVRLFSVKSSSSGRDRGCYFVLVSYTLTWNPPLAYTSTFWRVGSVVLVVLALRGTVDNPSSLGIPNAP